MSWKRQTSSIQQPQHLSASTLPLALGNLVTNLQQWAMSPANPMSLSVALLIPHLPGLLPVFSNIPIHCSAPGSQRTSILSTKRPAVLKFSCGCTTLSPNPQPTLAWRNRSPLNGCNSQKLPHHLHHQPPTVHLRQTLLPITLPPPPRLALITELFNSEKHLEM